MNWNIHSYYINRKTGLLGQLLLSEEEEDKLKGLRSQVRLRITTVFEEAAGIAKELRIVRGSEDSLHLKLNQTTLRYLLPQDMQKVSKLLFQMDDDAINELINLKPRFWTQGSFQYKTLNKPFSVGQEMDIDDGTYLPMGFFESEPKIGHLLLTLLVDSALKSLVAENLFWSFESKRTCARIKISKERTHIDVPMYAIPKDQFLKKEIALRKSFNNMALESISASFDEDDSEYEKLDSKSVNLALRDNNPSSPKWMNSDPKIVDDWFEKKCHLIGRHLRKVCRFMKAWRDAQWDIGGPSSISLMAATVEVLQREQHNPQDMDDTMKVVANHLYLEYQKGIESPDDTDEKLLFPCQSEPTERELDIVERLKKLPSILYNAGCAETKVQALDILSTAFGDRVNDTSLITRINAAPAFLTEPMKGTEPSKISNSMVSG